ncbi:aspartate--tRNA ligase [Candidatus Methylacidithermus pantelleriae]|nr:aspartate--tRNA ligase [Candidatus Methylacidithermus pantelleriae]
MKGNQAQPGFFPKRTHHCHELRRCHIGQRVTLIGWVHSRRDHGGVVFVDLRDREGITQVVFHPDRCPEATQEAHRVREESVLQVWGEVAARPPGTENRRLATGEIEVNADGLRVVSPCAVLPFPLHGGNLPGEELRLSYRFLDLRRRPMLENLRIRHRVLRAIRDYLDGQGFIEVETPILSKSTPEGARDFLVPSRLHRGCFYALPQAPQQYKQLLMVAGLERYYQIARCFRDEDLRADRQPEFTQIDLEASFVDQEELFGWVEGFLEEAFGRVCGVELSLPFPRLSYWEAIDRYGTEKPDLRWPLALSDVSEIFSETGCKIFRAALEQGGVIKAINAKGLAELSLAQLEGLIEEAKSLGAGGLAYVKVEGKEWKSPIARHLTEKEKEALSQRLEVEPGDLLLFSAESWEIACKVLGKIRERVMSWLSKSHIPKEPFAFVWITDFPLFQFDKEANRWEATHHPFTRPHPEDWKLFEEGQYEKVRALAYDLVLNGVEIGSGSLRVHEPELQARIFQILGLDPMIQEKRFGHLLRALSYGAPPHGGIALGVDRLVMMMAGATTIRDVIAFPKNSAGVDLLTGSPTEVELEQLRELGIRTVPYREP